MARFILSLAAVALLASPAFAQTADVSGDYNGTFGATSFHQDGAHVTGTYAYHGGSIDGQLDGATLRFGWTEEDGSSGRGLFTVAGNGDLVGSWGSGGDDHSGGPWVLSHGALPAPTAAATGTGNDYFVDGSPHAGSWVHDVRLPFDIIGSSNGSVGGLQAGMAGLGVDFGYFATDQWYVGASADAEYAMYANFDSDAGGSNLTRYRGALELRDYFHQGSAGLSVNCGPVEPTPRHDWIGLRAGAERVDGQIGSSYGPFADLSIGTDFQLGHTAVGMYGGVVASLDSPTAFEARNDLSPDSSSVMSVGITLGMRVTLD